MVFPIVESDHYYVIGINLKNPRFDILDSVKSEDGLKKYGYTPQNLVSAKVIDIEIHF